MKYRVENTAVNGRYQARISIYALTQHEEELIAAHGEPLVELGGSFSGTHARPNHTDTVIATSINNSATLVPVLDKNGKITSITVSAGGSYGGQTPALSATGVGVGFTAVAVMTGNAITSVTVSDGGYGWQKTPVTVAFALPAQAVGICTGFPVQQSFDINDYVDADVRMKTWVEAVVARIAAAHAQLLKKTVVFQGETVTTL